MPAEDQHAMKEVCKTLMLFCIAKNASVFEKNFVMNGKIHATVFCFVGENAEELTGLVREHLHKLGINRNE